MKKLITPYAGNDKYAFFSYCHRDEKKVYPIISELMNRGCHIWYDAAIKPGLEWPEVIAEHLSACTACVAFVSNDSLMSHNCRKEINFALMKNKPLLIVMLDDVQLSPGMEMQLSTVQSVLAYRKNIDVISALEAFDAMADCFGHAGIDEVVPFPEMIDAEKENSLKAQEMTQELPPFHSEVVTENRSENEQPVSAPSKQFYLVRASSGQCIVWKGRLTVGRSQECGYPLSAVSEVSMHHAELIIEDQNLYVVDRGSTNGTFVNDRKLSANQKYELVDGDELCFAREKFNVRCGTFERRKRICIEEIRNCRSSSFPADVPVVIGSQENKCTLCISGNNMISRNHLRVETEGPEIFVTDLISTNGSYILGEKLKAGKKTLLSAAVTIADEPLYISFEPDRTEE